MHIYAATARKWHYERLQNERTQWAYILMLHNDDNHHHIHLYPHHLHSPVNHIAEVPVNVFHVCLNHVNSKTHFLKIHTPLVQRYHLFLLKAAMKLLKGILNLVRFFLAISFPTLGHFEKPRHSWSRQPFCWKGCLLLMKGRSWNMKQYDLW